MTPAASEVLRRFDALERHLQSKGFPATSPWWLDTIRSWYRRGTRRLVARVGRRGGKSSTLCRLGVVEALYGQHKIPPGDVGVVAIVSARRPDALERLRTIGAILDALGVPYTPRGDSLELDGRPIVFTVFTASIAGVSGFTSIFILLDECAKWRDSDSGANPAAVVIGSISPTMATQPNARMVLSSSPMGLLDAHADAFALGDTAHQVTAHASTWAANPTVTEEQTHELEPDEVAWAREYAAIPQAEGETSLLTDVALTRLVRPCGALPRDHRHRYVATMDPATRGNAWTLAVTTLSDERVRRVAFTHEWMGTRTKPLVAGQVFKEMGPMLAEYGLRHVHSDQWSEDTLREIASQHAVHLIVDTPWTQGTKADAYDALRTLVRESKLDLPNDPTVKADLLGIREKLTRNGIAYDLASAGSRHSDFAPTIAMGVVLAKIPATPLPMLLSTGEEAAKARNEWLLERQKERKREERFGRLPVTHR